MHSAEALELVREHLGSVLGGPGGAESSDAPQPFSNALVRMSKLQAAQVYAASVMFGYFLRRVDARFQLERTLGTLPRSAEDSVRALEALFNRHARARVREGGACVYDGACKRCCCCCVCVC